MVSAAGLLFMGVQTRNLNLSDRMRALTREYRGLLSEQAHHERLDQIVAQLALFERRIRLSQRALEMLYLAIVCFVMTSLLLVLASAAWLGRFVIPAVIGTIFVLGVALLLASLVLEFLELRAGLKTMEIETREILKRGGSRR